MSVREHFEQVEPLSLEERVIIEVAKHYFWFFLEEVYIKSFEGETYTDDGGNQVPFEFGIMHREWAILMQLNPRLCLLSARAHLKSTVALAFAFWHMFRVQENGLIDILYLAYKTGLAVEQVEKLSRYIAANPFCRHWRDLKPYSGTMINYLVDFGEGPIGEVRMRGDGVMSAVRGRHPKVTICDDILSDFANPLSSVELARISRVFRQSIMSLPANPDDPLLVVGTPQSYEDLLYELAANSEFLWLSYPAIVDDGEEEVQWPEKFTYQRLQRIKRQVGPSAFEVEYQMTPVNVANQFFTREEILGVTDSSLSMWQLDIPFNKSELATYAGCDIGRKVHPSHVAVFLELPSGTLVEIYHRFLDQYPFNKQVALLNQIADVFHLSRGYFDATYNAMEDRNLSPVWRGRQFSRKLKADMATLFEKRVFAEASDPGIILLSHPRQLNQIIVVDKLLNAATTVEGHGDSFWSIGLAVKAAEDGPSIVDIGSAGEVARPRGPTWLQQLRAR